MEKKKTGTFSYPKGKANSSLSRSSHFPLDITDIYIYINEEEEGEETIQGRIQRYWILRHELGKRKAKKKKKLVAFVLDIQERFFFFFLPKTHSVK